MDVESRRERERCALSLCAAGFAVEWLRPLPPGLKVVGPLLPEPAQPLPADLEVDCQSEILEAWGSNKDGHA